MIWLYEAPSVPMAFAPYWLSPTPCPQPAPLKEMSAAVAGTTLTSNSPKAKIVAAKRRRADMLRMLRTGSIALTILEVDGLVRFKANDPAIAIVALGAYWAGSQLQYAISIERLDGRNLPALVSILGQKTHDQIRSNRRILRIGLNRDLAGASSMEVVVVDSGRKRRPGPYVDLVHSRRHFREDSEVPVGIGLVVTGVDSALEVAHLAYINVGRAIAVGVKPDDGGHGGVVETECVYG